MPIRRSASVAVAAVLLALSSRGARACPIAETEPICALLDEGDVAPASDEPPARPSAEIDGLRAAFAAQPDSSAHAAALAAALDDDDQPRAARRLLESYLVDHPRAIEAIHALLELEWTSDRTARAHELALSWRALAPRDPRALLHELVTAITFESEPDVEGRIAELARVGDDPTLSLAACEALAPPRMDRCVTRLVDLHDWRRAEPETRQRLFALVLWRGELEQAQELLAREEDAALRADAALRLAERASWSRDCATAFALIAGLDVSSEQRAAIDQRCQPKRAPREAFVAALAAGEIERALRESWSLSADRDPVLERAVRARLERHGGDRRLWELLARFAGAETGADAIWAEWAAAQPDNAEPLSRLASDRFLRGEIESGLEALHAALERARGEERGQLEERWLQHAHWERSAAISSLLAREIETVDAASSRRARLAAALSARAEGRASDALELVHSVRSGDDDHLAESLERELLAAVGDEAGWVAHVERDLPELPRERRDAWIAGLAQGEGLSRLARERLARALAADPGDPDLWRTLGELELGDERTAAAIDALRRAVALRPEAPWPRSLLADALSTERRWSEALDVLTDHAGAERFFAGELLDLSFGARSADQPFVADDALDRAAAVEPEAPDVRFELAARSAREGRRGEASEQLAAFVALSNRQLRSCVSECDIPALVRRARDFLATEELARLEIE